MKKVFIQIRQWVLKHRKRLIYGVLAFFICQFCFFNIGGIENEVFAAEDGQTQRQSIQEKITEMNNLNKTLQKIIYVLVYPFLFVAGKLVDNTFVYGEVFKFDVVLWDLWIIMRNVANFALGFIFIFYIFKYLITQKEEYGPKKLLPKALIAGVGIQASWFIMAVLIDISTIMIYGVGGLPISVLGTSDNNRENLKYNPYVLNTVISVDVNDLDTYQIYLSNPDKTEFISSCKTFTYSSTGYEQQLIIAPEMVYYQSGKNECYPTKRDRCHEGDQVYQFRASSNVGPQEYYQLCSGRYDKQNDWKEKLSKEIVEYENMTTGNINNIINEGVLLRIGQTGNKIGLDEGNEIIGSEWGSLRLEDVLSGSYLGVFSTLYGSLLNAGDDLKLTSESNGSIYTQTLNTALSLGHMIAINIPLIVMLVVFMIRIGILRLAIVLSPIIVLLRVFDFEKKIDGLKVKVLEYLKVENLIGIIFSPVIICFAVSMSTVLVRIISGFNRKDTNFGEPEVLGGLIKLSISGIGVSTGKLIISILGIAITRFLMRAAVKSSAIGKSGIVEGLEKFAKTSLGSLPVVPIPTKDGTKMLGFNSVFGGNGREGIISQYANNIKSKYDKESNEALDQILNPKEAKEKVAQKAKEEQVNSYIKTLTNLETVPENWQTAYSNQTIDENGKTVQTTYASLSDEEKKRVIKAINEISNIEKRKDLFGGENKTFKIGDAEYKFVAQDGKGNSVNKWLTNEEIGNLK